MKRKIAALFIAMTLVLTNLSGVLAFHVHAADNNDLSALKEIWLSEDQYYYDQLSEEFRAFWEFDIANVLNYPDNVRASESNKKYQSISSMIYHDSPRIFWIDWIGATGMLCYHTGSSSYYAPQWPDGVTLDTLKEKFLSAIERDVAEIRDTLPESPTTYDIVRAIAVWLCDNNTYNYEQTSSHRSDHDPVLFDYMAAHSAYSAIVAGDEFEPVCEGYALAFKVLCEEFGIESLCISGVSAYAGNGRHMWNYVKLDDGQWYLADITNMDNDHANDADYRYHFILASNSVAEGYTPDEYLGSEGYGVENCASFAFPKLADRQYQYYVEPPQITASDVYGGVQVTITGVNKDINTSNLYLYYTTDGEDPTTDSQFQYKYNEKTVTKDLWLNDSATVKAMLQAGGSTWAYTSYSSVSSMDAVVRKTDVPLVTYDGEKISIVPPLSASSDVQIYYTVDGNNPVYVLEADGSVITYPDQNLYFGGFDIPDASDGFTVIAIAVDKGCSASELAAYTVTHEHDFSGELQSDEIFHWHECPDDGEIDALTPHSYDHGVCFECGYKHVHTELKAVADGDDGHHNVCEECGFETAVLYHNYNSGVCTDCGHEHIAHDHQKGICTVCGAVDPNYHEHDFNGAWKSDEAVHWHECPDDGEKDTLVPHSYDNGVCMECGYKHVHTALKTVPDGEAGHHSVCAECGFTGSIVSHEFNGYSSDENVHARGCISCEYSESSAHTYAAGEYSSDDLGHWQVCGVCGRSGAVEGHILNSEGVCDICSYHDHEHVPEWTYDDNSHWQKCTVGDCTYEESRENHALGGYNSDDGSHYRECTSPNCGYSAIGKHSYIDGKCEICDHAHAIHSYTDWQSDGAETHSRTCAICGIVEKQSHSWGSGVVTKEPTENEDGIKTFICSECKAEKTEKVDKLDHMHQWGDWKITDAPTETASGKAERTCKVNSSHVETVVVPELKNADVWKLTDETDASCASEGSRTYSSEYGEVTVVVEKFSHTEVTIKGKAATCAEDGLTDGTKCSVCGEILVKQEVIPATGHTEVTIKGKAATCTESGLTDGIKCSACGEILVKQEVISATGHTEVTIKGKAATCTEDGLTDGIKCSVCGEILVKQEVIPATGHTEVTIKGKAATCTESGLTDGIKCSVCGEILAKQEVIPAKGHTKVTIKGKAATCTESGLTDGIKCSVCGEILVKQEVIPATGHTEVTINGKAATCTEDGLTEGIKCSVCGEILVKQEVIPATGHTEVTIKGKAATCTESGLTDGIKCSVCGEILVKQEVIPETGHKWVNNKCSICGKTKFTSGDLNGDGLVNITDAIELLKYIAKLDNNVVNEAGTDIDGNGAVNINDAIALLRQIAGLD